MSQTNFTNSYLITNRNNPQAQDYGSIYPLPAGQLYFYVAPGQYNSASNAYKQVNQQATSVIPPTFAAQLEQDLQVAINNGCPQITVYVHGLANYFTDTCNELGTYGSNLLKQDYKGLLIAYDWPCYGEVASFDFYSILPYAFPPGGTKNSIRENINGSVDSFINLLGMLASLCAKHDAKLNFICHSEGNYMLMLGMHKYSLSATSLINQVLLVAADINTGAVQVETYSSKWSGQLYSLNPFVTGATVYWSSHDDVLPTAEGWPKYHNPRFPARLGLHGPESFNNSAPGVDTLMSKAYGLDCSLVVNHEVMMQTPTPPTVSVHSSYFYIPQVLQDMTQTLTGIAPAKVTNRVSANKPDGRAFVMRLATELLTGPIIPAGYSGR